MIANGRQLKNIIDNILIPLGYIRKIDTWYLHTQECICFFTIDKSPYGGQYSAGFGCFLKELEITSENKEYPPYYKSHLRIGFHFFLDNDEIDNLFDLEDGSFEGDERENTITEIVEKHAVSFLNELKTKKGIKAIFEKMTRLENYSYLILRQALGLVGD